MKNVFWHFLTWSHENWQLTDSHSLWSHLDLKLHCTHTVKVGVKYRSITEFQMLCFYRGEGSLGAIDCPQSLPGDNWISEQLAKSVIWHNDNWHNVKPSLELELGNNFDFNSFKLCWHHHSLYISQVEIYDIYYGWTDSRIRTLGWCHTIHKTISKSVCFEFIKY